MGRQGVEQIARELKKERSLGSGSAEDNNESTGH